VARIRRREREDLVAFARREFLAFRAVPGDARQQRAGQQLAGTGNLLTSLSRARTVS
jgi:hypothetical protein